LKTLQEGQVPGLSRRDPPQATGGPSQTPRHARGRRGKATGRHSKEQQNALLSVLHWNAESVGNKKAELEHFLHERNISICCIQETHLQADRTFKVRGYQCFRNDRVGGRKKGGVMTLVRNNINACVEKSHMEDSEFQILKIRAKTTSLTLVNFYCPNDKSLTLDPIQVSDDCPNLLVVGDFNSHSQSWGYEHMDRRGEEVESWQDENKLILINRPTDPPTFYSRCWQTTSSPDLAFCSEEIGRNTTREVMDQLGGSDHRPVLLTLGIDTTTEDCRPRWNYKKANWWLFKHRSSELCKDITVQGRNINSVVRDFNASILKAAGECIPRGARKNYKPYWSKELELKEQELSRARKEAEDNPSLENNNRLQKTKAQLHRSTLQAKRTSWREKTKSLNFEKDSTKLWKLTKQLNDESSRAYHKITLTENDRILTQKQAANRLADTYAKASDIHIKPDQQKYARGEQRKRMTTKAADAAMEQPPTCQELKGALKKLKLRKSPGPDGISNEMLRNMGVAAINKLLEIFKLSWEQGALPQIWKEATMMPIHKKGKDPKEPSSYRPISLTSCVVKTLERIVNDRLKWYLESKHLLAPEQARFRQCRSTEDQATLLSQEVEDAFQEQKLVMTTWIDLQKAFDTVWTDGLLVKLLNARITSKMYNWIKSFLHNRRARVMVEQVPSKKVLLRHGVPQGGVISPTLFLIFINDLVDVLPKGVKAALYADDLVLWCKEEYPTTARHRMQQAANKLKEWTDKWCISINKEKSSTTLFTLSTKHKAGTIFLGDTPLKEDNEATYLGVTFDRRMTWKPHIAQAEGKARRKLAILRKLAGTTWGANERILKSIYQGTVRPHLEYGSTAWSNAAKTTLHTLDLVQNQALRIITGAMRSTPIVGMKNLTASENKEKRKSPATG